MSPPVSSQAGTASRPRVCKDCPPDSKRPAPFPGPRCHTHNRAERKRKRGRKAERRVERLFGLTPQEYDELYEAQDGRCAIPGCRATGQVKRLAVDHDHYCPFHPPEVACRRCLRGLLCGPHNYELIGKYQNQLQAALDYLADPPARRVLARTRP